MRWKAHHRGGSGGRPRRRIWICAVLLVAGWGGCGAGSLPERTWLPTGASVTPLAAAGSEFQTLNPQVPALPGFLADHAVSSALSPDGTTLLVLTSGFNRHFDARAKPVLPQAGDYVFVFDVRTGPPRQLQALAIPSAFVGLAFAPDGQRFYLSGGRDDALWCFVRSGERWQQDGAGIPLGHARGAGLTRDKAIALPEVAGLAVTADGRRIVLANFNNDTVSIVDWARRRVEAELDLRPGKLTASDAGKRGGTFPYAVVAGAGVAYVSSLRDREVIAMALANAPSVRARMPLTGNPVALLLNRAGTRLYVAEDNVDRIAIINLESQSVEGELALQLGASGAPARGLSPNAMSLSPDERTLYVSLGGVNALAVVDLPGRRVRGMIPTGWYPSAVVTSRDGRNLYVLAAKSPSRANPDNCEEIPPPSTAQGCPAGRPREPANAHVLQLSKGGLFTMPVPDAAALAGLTQLVRANNEPQGPLGARETGLFRGLRQRIRHIIYIIKENRTYDQVLGDLPVGNGDPDLAQFPEAITPNQHRIAAAFVDLDDFYASGEVSGTGWPWSVAARTTDVVEKTVPPHYAERGFSDDSEGTNRGINVGLATLAQRRAANPLTPDDKDVLAGVSDVMAPDGPDEDEPEQGRLWNEALRRHQSVRNYGFFIDLDRYARGGTPQASVPLLRNPAASHTVVAFPADPALATHTDRYFRGFDNRFPDYYRVQEWAREFAGYERSGTLPRLELVRLMHDHLGDFAAAQDGLNTPQLQMADNDYAVGLLLERVAHSRFASDTLIVSVEDDAQDGPDHVDAHRTLAFLAGPYVRHGAVVSTRYATTDLLRTIELILGLRPLNIHDAYARPMSDAFDLKQAHWQFTAVVPAVLRASALPLPKSVAGLARPHCIGFDHDAAYWAGQTAGMDFAVEDKVDSERLNQVLWTGLQGDRAYPSVRTGLDLRAERAARLQAWAARCPP